MPYKMTWEPGRLVIYVFGHATIYEAVSATREWQADARFDSLHYVIYDSCAVESIEPFNSCVAEELAVMNLGAAFTNPRIQIGVVSPDGLLASSVAAVANLTGNKFPIQLFCTRSDADVWSMADATGIQAAVVDGNMATRHQ